MKGMCHHCYNTGVELGLTEIEGTVNNPFEVVEVPLCEKCRE